MNHSVTHRQRPAGVTQILSLRHGRYLIQKIQTRFSDSPRITFSLKRLRASTIENQKRSKYISTMTTTTSSATAITTNDGTTEITFVGNLHFVLSLHLPEEKITESQQIEEEGKQKLLVTEWIGQEFLCHASSYRLSIELVGSLDMKSQCAIHSRLRKRILNSDLSTTTIVWNNPTATSTGHTLPNLNHLNYTSWNVSYPVLEWGDLENVQQFLQFSLNERIKENPFISENDNNGKMMTLILAVYGQEEHYFDSHNNFFMSKGYNDMPKNMEQTAKATRLQMIGFVILILHTIIMISFHIFGKSYVKRIRIQSKQKERAESSFTEEEEEVDRILGVTRGREARVPKYISPSKTNNNLSSTRGQKPTASSSTTSSLRSKTSYSSIMSNTMDSLFLPMEDDNDGISEDGSDGLLRKSPLILGGTGLTARSEEESCSVLSFQSNSYPSSMSSNTSSYDLDGGSTMLDNLKQDSYRYFSSDESSDDNENPKIYEA